MKSIGGYFELEELGNQRNLFHQNALPLNTGRNAFEYILRANQYQKVFIPYYSCNVLFEPIIKLKLEIEYYSLDENLEPVFDYTIIQEKDAFLYINYFGLKDSFITSHSFLIPNLIIDNSQSFYSMPQPNIDTFYSVRKFFGVPDGAYVYSNKHLNNHLDLDVSENRISYLLKRRNISAEAGYPDFIENEHRLNHLPILRMSTYTTNVCSQLNYEESARKRKINYQYFEHHLGPSNLTKLLWDKNQIPLCYPYLSTNNNLRSELNKSMVYNPTYWPNLKILDLQETEKQYLEHCLFLPIDQRYDIGDMEYIKQLIL